MAQQKDLSFTVTLAIQPVPAALMPSTKRKLLAEGNPSVVGSKNDEEGVSIRSILNKSMHSPSSPGSVGRSHRSTVRRGNRPGLRASNQKKHPGLVDVSGDELEEHQSAHPTKKPRRSGEEVAAEKQAKADQVKKDAADNLLKKRNVAQVEDDLASKELHRHQNAARPPPGPIQVKAMRPVADMVAAAQDDITRIEQAVKASMPLRESGEFFLMDGSFSWMCLADDIDIEGVAKEPPVGQGQTRARNLQSAAALQVGDDCDDSDHEDDGDYCPDADNKVSILHTTLSMVSTRI